MKNKNLYIFILAILFSGGFFYFENGKEMETNAKIANLQNTINDISIKLEVAQKNDQKEITSLREAMNKETALKKSQDDLLTTAVAKVTPAVVSIVISKDVPKLEVTYKNPFGDNPIFGDFNIQIPVYTQKGTEHQKVGAGTGFIVRQDGYILTNKHVVSDADVNAEYTVLLSKGEQKKATVVFRDDKNDIALIKIEGKNYPTVSFGDYKAMKLGQTVLAIGNALGEYNNSVSVGIVSGLDRTIQAQGGGVTEELKGIIQTDAAINPGNSGGPLINLVGEVIGINVATAIGSNNISFSIPIDEVKNSIGKIIKL